MRTKKLTPFARILLFLIFVGVVGFGVFKLGGFADKKSTVSSTNTSQSKEQLYANAEKIDTKSDAMKISLDEWIGWKPILDANGGLKTQPGSIYDKLGLKLEISVINDGTQSSNALIKGDLNGAGYTVNRLAFLIPKFKEANIPISMSYIPNSSSGGDGILAKKNINRIEDLVDKKVGIPRYSEAQTLVEGAMAKSSLTPEQITSIRKNMKMFDTPDDAAKAFFAGQLDAAATWQPYLTQAQQATDAHILFSTKDATNIILDGLIFRQDYLSKHKDQVSKFVEGALKAQSLYKTDTTTIKNTFPMFSTMDDKDIIATTDDATLANCTTNIQMLSPGGTARILFTDMSNIWKSIGEKSDASVVDSVFDDSIVKELASKFPNEQVQKVQITSAEKDKAKTQDDKQALLTKRLSINFETGSSSISSDSYATLNDFANTAKILNGTVLQIVGNTDNVGSSDENKSLSEKRARSIALYLQSQGIESSRFIIEGRGDSNPIGDNSTTEGKSQNRRTDIFFKSVK